VNELARLLAPRFAVSISDLRKRWVTEAQVRAPVLVCRVCVSCVRACVRVCLCVSACMRAARMSARLH